MKIISIALLMCYVFCFEFYSQQLRTFELDVVERKGNSNIYAYFTSNDSVTQLSDKGIVLFDNIFVDDTLIIYTNKRYYFFPTKEKESISVVIKRNNIYLHDPNSIELVKMERVSPNALKMNNEIYEYSNLAEYMRGRIAGVSLVFEGGEYNLYIRGPSSFLLDSSALIVLDGMVLDSFKTANNSVSVREIESIEVIKDGDGYGMRGANGVVVITTKKGK